MEWLRFGEPTSVGTGRHRLAAGGRHFDDRPVLQAFERIAHRNDLVSRHGVDRGRNPAELRGFAGNRNDATTVKEIVAAMEKSTAPRNPFG